MLALDKLVHATRLGERIVAFKLWFRVLYRTDLTAIGAQSGPSPALAAAFRGETQSHISALNDEQHQIKGTLRSEPIETYAPAHDPRTGSILAVSEIDQTTDVLVRAVGTGRLQRTGNGSARNS
jgi:hypothetical protein